MMSGARFALIVTSDTHTDPKLSSLRAPSADADELGRVLRDPEIGWFDVAISHNEPEHVVRRRLSAFFEHRGLDDLLVLHMSCHGVKDEDGRLYFATKDTEVDHLDATSIPADFVNRQMTRCRSRRIVLLLDCCYSGAFARGMVGRGGDRVDLKERFEGRGRIVLTASSAMEYSFEGDQTSGQGRPSVFTSAIVEGLSTGAADRDRDGFVTVDELYDFAFEQVRTVTPSQTPGKWVFDVQGDFYLARSAAGLAAAGPVLPVELGAAMVSPFARVRRGAVEELGAMIGNPDEKYAAPAFRALVELTRDDSNEVARAARRYVGEPEAPAPEPLAPEPLAPEPRASKPAAPELSAPEPPAPEPPASGPSAPMADLAAAAWIPRVCRGAAVALVGAAAVPLLVTDATTRWNVFAVLAPFEALVAARLLWRVSGAVRRGRMRTRWAIGVLIAIGLVMTAGSLALISFTAKWAEPAAVVGSGFGLLGALMAGVAGLGLLRARSPASAPESSLTPTLVLGLLGVALSLGALFVPYDGSSSLWTELVGRGASSGYASPAGTIEAATSIVIEGGPGATFAYLPSVAVLVMVAAILLLRWRRLLAVGMLDATGVLTAAHFLGMLLAASLALGEVGEVGPAWLLGVAGGVLAAVAGWRQRPDQARSIQEARTPRRG